MNAHPTGKISRSAIAGCGLAVMAAVLMLCGFAGVSTHMLPQEASFRMFLFGVALSFTALSISLMGWRQTRAARGRNLALTGIGVSLLLLIPMSNHIVMAFTVPPIHDITTDTESPPLFVDILPLRASAPNTAEYRGGALAEMQKAGYPDIAPLTLAMPPADAFVRVENLVKARGWVTVASVIDQGRIEATAETKLMRFKDDIVIRVSEADEGSKIDMRSVSRFGQSDLGVNAKRIREFLSDMKAAN